MPPVEVLKELESASISQITGCVSVTSIHDPGWRKNGFMDTWNQGSWRGGGGKKQNVVRRFANWGRRARKSILA